MVKKTAAAKVPTVVSDALGTEVKKRTSWHVSSEAPITVDDLDFTSRDERGCISWWDVTPPKSKYYSPHYELGRGYAFDLLDLIHNPKAKLMGREVEFISCAVARSSGSKGSASDSVADGFFNVLGEFLTTGTANR
jgi:hypothetical protein